MISYVCRYRLMKMYKKELTKEEKAKLEKLRNNMQRYQELLTWQKLRRAEIKMLELRLRYDYRSTRREMLMDKYLVTLRPHAKKKDNWYD
mgnify:CR=1 FL=1